MDGEDNPRLSARGYERLRRSCRTHREELLVRLAGEAGVRAGEITRIRPADVTDRGEDATPRYLLTVREADGGERTVPLLTDLAREFWQYVNSNDIDSGDPVIDVSERRLQMLVAEITERARAETDLPELEDVTPATLRQYFAHRLLVDHGVDVRVVTAVGGWEGVDSLLSALSRPSTAEVTAAFERLDNESAPDRRLPEVVDSIDRIVDSLAPANSRSAVERQVCQQLTADQYAAAWILEADPKRDRVVVRRHAGGSPERFEGAGDSGIARRTLQTGRSFVAPNDPGPAADYEESGLLAAVPIAHGDTEHGVLVVQSESSSAFDDPERTALEMLGRQVGFALTAVDRKQLLLGGVVLEVTFQYDDHRAALVDLSQSLASSLTLDGAVPTDAGLLCFVHLEQTPAQQALEAATDIDGIDSARLVRSDESGGVLELALSRASPLLTITDRGGTVTALTIADGQATLTCELAPETDLRAIHDSLHDTFGADLRSKQERTTTNGTAPAHGDFLDEQLTEKQRDVIRTAYHAGYFEWPRESTAEDLAESMDISSPTLHNHLRRAQQSILDEILDE
ncbi:GAF domain-containing protein [Halovenus sp. WSH3]|uniref:GAF domain-containing protein n=1 Tax=Halovenus carboxidivorans TaxID=2692199 RepID=A0A6B0SZ36_9EURY|nr:bacterio-opsin activator domain-containing protein [Halovenus carboxidivorans]MXR51078.1 GAF domain-containing protein [Halovenus carboxidivorans]